MNIIIIANGLFPTGAWVESLLKEADSIVCCDGALKNYIEWASPREGFRKGVAVVGDGDSLDPDLVTAARQEGFEVQQHVVDEQEYNDLTKATHYAIAQARLSGCKESAMRVCYIGATGLREDHTIGNISLLAYYMELYPEVEFSMRSDYGTLIPMEGSKRFRSHKGQEVSIFSLTPQVPLTVEGLQYPIQGRCLDAWWQGTLNVALGDSFEVSGGKVIVYELRIEN